MRVAILAHDRFPHRAKTALGVMRYGDQAVDAIIDRATAGSSVSDHTELVPDAPIVADMESVGAVDALIIGVAPIGGGFEEDWRPDIRNALERGIDVIAGLHTFLAEDEEFAALAAETGADIVDVRRPPPDLAVSQGIAGRVDAHVICTVGTDCSVGKMTATFELVEALRERGVDAAPIPTGQTGIMIEGWGTPIDRVIADFVAGAVEELILERGDDHEVLVVEGQGSLLHPAYSGVTCGILHGSMPDSLVICHDPTRTAVNGYESFPIPPLDVYADRYDRLAEPVSGASVVAGALNTSGLDDDAAAEALTRAASALDGPVTDVIRYGPGPIMEAIK